MLRNYALLSSVGELDTSILLRTFTYMEQRDRLMKVVIGEILRAITEQIQLRGLPKTLGSQLVVLRQFFDEVSGM